MRIKEFLSDRRMGINHQVGEISEFVRGFCDGKIPDYQVSAWLMATVFKPLNEREMLELTDAMVQSGRRFQRQINDGFWVDKHSTGGVGDKTSLILAPLVIETSRRLFGPGRVKIPMVSGRGLGHTGGTLDKLESVPGFNTALSDAEALTLLVGSDFFMMGQTDDFVPADRKLYSLRDVTATVDCLPLIVSSIMSKKIAEELDGLVIDLKCGRGAFMKSLNEARALGLMLQETARRYSIESRIWITAMEHPLGRMLGNGVEVDECFRFLNDFESSDEGLRDVVLTLGASMLEVAGKMSFELAKEALVETLQSRRAVATFLTMIKQQGGDWDKFLLNLDQMRMGSQYELKSVDSGYIHSMDALKMGKLLVELGGGRLTASDRINGFVGFEIEQTVGSWVEKGQRILKAYLPSERAKEGISSQWESDLRAAVIVGKDKVASSQWIIELLK